MIVAQILKLKGSSKVETVDGRKTLSEVAAILSEMRIGALIVSADGAQVEGIVSERDIIRILGREGVSCMNKPVAEVMTRNVQSCAPEQKADQVLDAMTKGRFRHMPVMDGGALRGVISIGDVVKARISEIEHENEALAEMIKGY